MFNEVEGLIQKVTTGEIDPQSVTQATDDSLSSMDHNELTAHLQTAASNAQKSGQGNSAQQLMELLSEHGSNPQDLKAAAISLISSNPQLLSHFAPGVAKAILGNAQ